MMKRIFEEKWGYILDSKKANAIPENMPQEEIRLGDEQVVYITRGFTECKDAWCNSEVAKNFQPKMYYRKMHFYKNGKFTYIKNGKPRNISLDKYFKYIFDNMFLCFNNLINNEERQNVGLILQSFLEINYPLLKEYVDFSKEHQGYYSSPYIPSFGKRDKISYSKIVKSINYCLAQSKRIKKLIFSGNIYKVIYYYAFKYVGIKDCNILYSLFNNENVYLFEYRKAQRFYLNCLKEKYGDDAEVIFAKRILNSSKTPSDTNSYYDMFKFLNIYLFIKSKNAQSLKIVTNNEIASHSIKELHDILFHAIRDSISLYYNPTYNNPLEMTEERKSFDNIEVEGVNFCVPKTYQEFSELSDVFDNCVVTYYGKAMQQNCHIITAFRDNKPFACIELNKCKEIIQCSGVSNSRLSKESREICTKYFDLIGAIEYNPANHTNNGIFGYVLDRMNDEDLPF